MPELPPEEGKRRDAPAAEAPITALPPRPAARESWRLADWVMLGYGVVAGTLLLRWLAGNLALQWLLRQRRTAPVHLAELFAEMAAGKGCRLVVSERAGAPFSIGLFKKTVVLPAALVSAIGPAVRSRAGSEHAPGVASSTRSNAVAVIDSALKPSSTAPGMP